MNPTREKIAIETYFRDEDNDVKNLLLSIMYNKNELMSAKNNVKKTSSLILEPQLETEESLFTIWNDHRFYKGKLYLSLKKLYFAVSDPTEYEFASLLFIEYSQWIRIADNKLYSKIIDKWRDELQIKIRSEAIRSMMSLAVADTGGFQAAKWLAENGFSKRQAGRPSKKEIEKQAKIEASLHTEIDGDYDRIQGVLN